MEYTPRNDYRHNMTDGMTRMKKGVKHCLNNGVGNGVKNGGGENEKNVRVDK